MFDAFGQTPTASRVSTYRDVIGDLDAGTVVEAIREAMRVAEQFPPGPGTIRRQALAIAGMRAGDPIETPREIGPRIGPGDAPIGALFSGMERRVERSYQPVIARAREVRAERGLPDSLDARLYSLGAAEVELGYQEHPYACHCKPVRFECKHLDARLHGERAAAERRLRATGLLAGVPVTFMEAA